MQKINRNKMLLKFNKPANTLSPWESSIPIGNGNVGALIQGGVRYEKIMLSNINSVWLGSVGVLPDISDKMKEVRKCVDSKNQVLAGITIEKAFETKKYQPTQTCPLPIADFCIEQSVAGKHVTSYFRQINMDNGEASVGFSDLGTKVDRSCFVSSQNGLVYYEATKTGAGVLNLELSLMSHDYSKIAFDGKVAPSFDSVSVEIGATTLCFDQEYQSMHYGVVARVVVDNKATMQSLDKSLRIENAERVLVILKTYVAKSKEKEWQTIKSELLGIKQPSYERAFKEHIADYLKNTSKCELSISHEKENFIENLISNFDENSTLIYEKLFHFAKYLNQIGISCGENLPFVSGLWSYYYANDKQNADNVCTLPAIYSSSGVLGQLDKHKSVIEYFEKYADDLKKNAYRIYKSKGLMVPFVVARGTGLTGAIKAADISTVLGGAVIANMFYDYFLWTKDVKFLKNEALPFMCEIAKFYMNYFYLNINEELVSCPSYSPFGKSRYFENKNVGVYSSCPADFAIVRTLINNIISLSNNYSIPLSDIVEYQKFLNLLPQPRITSSVVAEYKEDDNSNKSAGVMHLYPVFGTKDITLHSSANIIAPYLNSVVQKIDKALFAQTIVSIGRLAEMSSILGHGDACISILRYMITNFMSQNLMFFNNDKTNMCAYSDGDNYFNIAGNQLLLSSIAECLVLSSGKNISILPSKPQFWTVGNISGVNTTLNCLVDVSWDDKKGNASVVCKALKNTTFNLMLFKGVKKVKGYDVNIVNPVIENISLSSGKSITIDIKY